MINFTVTFTSTCLSTSMLPLNFAVMIPLRSKSAKNTAFAMTDILKVVKLPEIYVDAGTKFKVGITKLPEEHEINFKSIITKYHHGLTEPVNVFIRNITKRLFKRMDVLELRNSMEVSTVWVRLFQQEVECHNNKVQPKFGMLPVKAFNMDKVVAKKPRKLRKEKVLPEDGLYRYFLMPGEEHYDSRRRATDNIWSRKTFRFSDLEQLPDKRVTYHLQDGPVRAVVREELMLIPKTTELPPESVM